MTTKTDELTITRTFDASRDRVWQAWTDPESLKAWWGPKEFTMPEAQIDLREGGEYLSAMKSPEGQVFWSKGTYRKIEPGKKLVMTDSFADENGNIVPATHYGMSPDFPKELLITLELEDEGGRTRMVLHHSGIAGISAEDMKNMKQGWEESFDKLAGFLGNK